jgi:hypothetical protein
MFSFDELNTACFNKVIVLLLKRGFMMLQDPDSIWSDIVIRWLGKDIHP